MSANDTTGYHEHLDERPKETLRQKILAALDLPGYTREEILGEIRAIAAPAEQGEVVAYRWRYNDGKKVDRWVMDTTYPPWLINHEVQPLYAAPPQSDAGSATPLAYHDQIALDAAHEIEAMSNDLHEAQRTARIQLFVLGAIVKALAIPSAQSGDCK